MHLEREAAACKKQLELVVAKEAVAQRRSWMHLEKTRVLHDSYLWLMAGARLLWALYSWRAGRLTNGDVVVVSALAFRILHGSRDLALALIGSVQQLGIIGEMLRVIAEPHGMSDGSNAKPYAALGEQIELRSVDYTYADGKAVFCSLNLTISAGEKVSVAGPSRSGKSTLLGLLQRLDETDVLKPATSRCTRPPDLHTAMSSSTSCPVVTRRTG